MKMKYEIINPEDMQDIKYDPTEPYIPFVMDMETVGIKVDNEKQVVTIQYKYLGILFD